MYQTLSVDSLPISDPGTQPWCDGQGAVTMQTVLQGAGKLHQYQEKLDYVKNGDRRERATENRTHSFVQVYT